MAANSRTLTAFLISVLLVACSGVQQAAMVGGGRRHSKVSPAVPQPAQTLGRVHLAYAVDSNQGAREGLLASLNSVVRHLAAPTDCTVHIIVPKEEVESMGRLIDCFKGQLDTLQVPEVVFHERQELPQVMVDYLTGYNSQLRRDLITPAAIARLYLADYLPDVSRVLWLDCDTIAQKDIAELYYRPMEHVIAAGRNIETLSVYVAQQVPSLQQQGVLNHPAKRSFNSGVLLINLDAWREQGISSKLEEVARNIPTHTGEDQVLLNLFFQDDYDRLEWRWNSHGLGTVHATPDFVVQQRSILHWTGAAKPWKTREGNYYHFYAPYDLHETCFS